MIQSAGQAKNSAATVEVNCRMSDKQISILQSEQLYRKEELQENYEKSR